MINLSSLSALIRTLRHTSGLDGPAAPVARVASVTPVAEDDAGAMTSTPMRPSPWARAQRTPPDLPVGADPRQGDVRRETPVQSARASSASAPHAMPSASAPVTDDAQSSALDFTAGARLLQAALRGTGLKTPVPPQITSAVPLTTSSRAPAPELARGLASAVAESGLFYESHLARALRRDYPIAALSREPQASWPVSTIAEGLTASVSPSALPETSSTLLTKQLDVLDTRAVVWVGDLWPGQRARIAFEEDAGNREAANDEDDVPQRSSWHTRITIDLPSLGRVQATLDLRPGALALALGASSQDTQARLTSAKAELDASLADAQLVLDRFDVVLEPDG